MQEAEWGKPVEIDCNLSTQRFGGGVVEAMQKRRELGTVRRHLLVAKRTFQERAKWDLH